MIDTRITPRPRNCVVITLKQIMDGSRPILYVANDDEDGLQFLSDCEVEEADVALVALNEIIELDETVLDVVDILPGSIACRDAVDDDWVVEDFSDED
jgi:hypothetical protein